MNKEMLNLYMTLRKVQYFIRTILNQNFAYKHPMTYTYTFIHLLNDLLRERKIKKV